jgi:lipopolysaccharide biosynthesis regulator YciM
MALSYQVLFTLFILALLLISWLLGYYARYRRLPELRPVPDADYFTGLNYLLNDEPDDAIDVFIDALEVNSSTFETHLALGKLLKRRGKVDRAIAHYHSLLALQRFNTRQTGEIKIHLIRRRPA